MSGASSAGDDFEVGRTNESGERSILLANNDDPDGYQEDFVLHVGIKDSKLLRQVAQGVDAVHATGTEALATGGAVGTIPEGNGLVGRGLNGVVGYVHAAPRSVEQEADARAGLLGRGGSRSVGVLGQGVNGVVGYTEAQPRDTAWENLEDTGVCGRGASIGVRGKGDNGGVRGDSEANAGVLGVSTSSSGVDGESQEGFGIRGASVDGIGVCGVSVKDVGGIFESERAGQVWLVPKSAGPLNSPSGVNPTAIPVQDRGPGVLPRRGEGGQLMTIQDNQGTCTLWFCVKGGLPARWAQVLLGPECDGQAP